MRRRGRPKERWIDEVRRSMTNHGLIEEDTRDKDRWRIGCKITVKSESLYLKNKKLQTL
jgi:hypothetical protein